MRKSLITGRFLFAGTVALVLSACSSTSDLEIAETFAAQRADMLSKIVPVQMNGYTLFAQKQTVRKLN